MLQNYDDWQAETPTIILDIPGILAKEHHADEELRSLTLEALSVAYPSITWARAYTDGSADEAAKNGGGGVFIKLPDGRSIKKSVATGQQSTNYRVEAYTLLAAAQTLNQKERLPTNTVFLMDCQSILQSFQSPGEDQMFSNIWQELSLLKNETSVTLLWTPCHCGVGGNEEADWLSKIGSKMEQSAHSMSYSKAKAIIRNSFRTEWRQRLDIGTEENSIHQPDRAARVTIFRLRIGHSQRLSHLRRLKISHSDECPCGTGPQTPYLILQSCPTFNTLRRQTWPSPVDAHTKLWRLVETLRLTADFALLTRLRSSMARNAEEEEELSVILHLLWEWCCSFQGSGTHWSVPLLLGPQVSDLNQSRSVSDAKPSLAHPHTGSPLKNKAAKIRLST